MAFHRDFSFVVRGGVVAYSRSRGGQAESLPPRGVVSVRFPAVEGPIGVGVTAHDVRQPTRVRVIGGAGSPTEESPSGGPGSLIEEFNNVAVRIELIPPGAQAPVRSLTTASGFSETEAFGFEHEVAAPAPKGEWTARVTNRDARPARVDVSVGSVISREPLRTEFLAHRLLDHTYLVILEALQPSAEIRGRTLTISFGEELRDFLGTDGSDGPLGTRTITLPEGVSVQPPALLNRFEVRARSGRSLLDAVLARFAAVRTTTEDDEILAANHRFRREWEVRVRPDDAVVNIKAGFSDINVTAAKDVLPGIDADAEAVIRNVTVDVYIAFDRDLERCDVLALSPLELEFTDFEGQVIDALGILPEALARLASRDSVFHSLAANDDHWLVGFTAIPGEPEPAPTPGRTPGHAGTHVPIGGVGGGVLAPAEGSPPPVPDASLGVLPPGDEFVVARPETLARLDKIDTLVFVMMENRSFDHMLGYLHKARGPRYEGLRGDESNRVEGTIQPLRMRHAPEVIGPPATRIAIDPEHGFTAVGAQIADGAMSGFAQVMEDERRGSAETVMTFYDGDDVKVYDELASTYNVCDHWFCAHAGPTFPNRFVTLGGEAPLLDNHRVDDPDLGFLPNRTIFDVLDDRGIRWALFESDLSVIRMFNRFRLNAAEVRPYRNRADQSQSFVEVARRGELPPVVFVEPNFSSIPPVLTANDDHPPADVRRGQNFIAEVVKALTRSPQWNRTMLVITYDEHGGFYDHVAPPGTSLGPPELRGRVPRVHPEGRDFMGPRVPAFIVSPLVSAGSVCKDVLDHTTIIKTILLRHRRKIPTGVFTQFGPRVNMISHLGVALDLDQPRAVLAAAPQPIAIRPERRVEPFAAPGNEARPDDFHEALRRAPLPKRRPASAPPPRSRPEAGTRPGTVPRRV